MPHTKDDRGTMLLGSRIGTEKDWREEERKLLTPLLGYHVNGNSAGTDAGLFLILKTAVMTLGEGMVSFLRRPVFGRSGHRAGSDTGL